MAKKEDFIIEQFKVYKVFLSGERASLHLKLPSGKAILRFAKGRAKKNKFTVAGKKTLYEINMPLEAYPSHIDLLRNEKPLYFFFSEVDCSSYITTSDEPVGEGE